MNGDGEILKGIPERRLDERDDRTGYERGTVFVCGCGRGCTSWPNHFERVKADPAGTVFGAVKT